MQRFKSAKSCQRFVAMHAAVCNSFNVQRHLIFRRIFREFRNLATAGWNIAAIAA